MTRRTLYATAVVAAVVLAACGGDDDTASDATTATPPPSATGPAPTDAPDATPTSTSSSTSGDDPAPDAPAAGGRLVSVIGSQPTTINASMSWSLTATVGCKIQDGLVSVSPDKSEVRPELAESWEISSDGLTYTFHLAEGVTWHDGEPFTSADVKWSYENINTNHPGGRVWLGYVESIDAPDDLTVVLNLSEPYAPLLGGTSCGLGGAISAQHALPEGADPLADTVFNLEPVGTGPFVFTELAGGDRIVLDHNDSYRKEGLPYLDGMTFAILPDAASMTQALEAGEIDYIDRLAASREDAVRLMDDPNYDVIMGLDSPRTNMIQLNLRREPFDNPVVRQALMMALDRDYINDAFFDPFGAVPENMIFEGLQIAATPDVSLSELYPYDPDAANALLDEAGIADSGGTRFSVELAYQADTSPWADVAEVVRLNWAEIGVDVVPTPLERTVLLDTTFQQRDFDAMLQIYASLGDPAAGVARIFRCEPDDAPANFGNPTGYCEQGVDELFDEGARATTDAGRIEAYQAVQAILAEDLPVLPFSGDAAPSIANTRFDLSGPKASYGGDTGWEYVSQIG